MNHNQIADAMRTWLELEEARNAVASCRSLVIFDGHFREVDAVSLKIVDLQQVVERKIREDSQ